VQAGVLIRAAGDFERVVVVQHPEVGTGFRPEIVGLGRMNLRVVSARGGKHVVICRGVSDLLADVDRVAINDGESSSIHQTVNEWSVGILINLLDLAGYLRGLRPVMILHRDNEYRLDIGRAGAEAAQCAEHGDRTQGAAMSDLQH
jgi:hypothetical protein